MKITMRRFIAVVIITVVLFVVSIVIITSIVNVIDVIILTVVIGAIDFLFIFVSDIIIEKGDDDNNNIH